MSAILSFQPIAVRAYTPLADDRPAPTRPARSPDPEHVFVLDTESGGDHAQHLTFGSARLLRSDRQRLDECLFHADELPAADRTTLHRYAATHDEDVDPLHRRRLRVLTRRTFLRDVFWPVTLKKGRALVVCFNAPFDLSRLSVGWGESRGRPYAGGVSLKLSSYRKGRRDVENTYRPRIAIRSIDSKRALIGFKRYRTSDVDDLIPEGAPDGAPDPRYAFRGHFLDLRTLAFALTNRGHSLRSACKAFGVPSAEAKGKATEYGKVTPEHIDYNRRDVGATAALYWKMREEYDRHPITLPITEAFSPASIGKAYLGAMGIPLILQRQPDFPPEILGAAMAAYYGGRAECRIRGVPLPVVYLDFLSMYPTVCSLMDIWRLITCEQIEVVDATKDMQALLNGITPDQCFDPQLWRQFVGLVQFVPEGHILPTRAHYGGTAAWQIGVNPLTATDPLWYTIPEAFAATLLSDTPPHVQRAWRLVPRGVLPTLRPVALRGQVSVDPREQDFFRVAIEQRHRLDGRDDLSAEEKEWLSAFLKVLANSAGYGIYAEMNPQVLPRGEQQRVAVYGNWEDPFTAAVHRPEEPGAYCFPPFAACIAGAARLMLALLESCVTELGGAHVMADTDSMAVVATEHGGLIACPGGTHRLPDGREAVRALSWDDVEIIRERFAALHPYDRAAVPG